MRDRVKKEEQLADRPEDGCEPLAFETHLVVNPPIKGRYQTLHNHPLRRRIATRRGGFQGEAVWGGMHSSVVAFLYLFKV